MVMVWTYGVYLVISLALTVWVGNTLFKKGRVFLLERFGEKADLADSVNHLLVVGFYLINFGYVCLALRYGGQAAGTQEAIEYLSTKIGIVLMVLGVMHFFNLLILSKLRKTPKDTTRNIPAVHPLPPQPEYSHRHRL